MAALADDLGQPRNIPHLWQQVLVFTFERGVGAIEKFLNVVIGHPLFRLDDAFVERVIEHITAARYVQHDADGETVHVGIQRAEMVGDLLRKHRQHAVGKVNRGAPISRFRVHGRVGRNKVRHIGNMHAKLKRPIANRLDIDGIVEVARGFRIDGDRVPLSEIITPDEVLLRKRVGRPGGLFFDLL